MCVLALVFVLRKALNDGDPKEGETDCGVAREYAPSIPNGAGKLAIAHITDEDCDLAHSDVTFVHVRKLGEGDTRRSLVFKYEGDVGSYFPEMEWTDKSTLHISVGNISEVMKQVDSVDGVKIVYAIGREEIPRSEVRLYSALGNAIRVFVVGLLLVVLCSSGVGARSILRGRNDTG
jgi:hypothetical protein